ncbi:MAG: response regulator [Planctomycetes bacterium]|nr:response regulator [Planctomycetota bacterium]
MLDFFDKLFDTSDFPARWHCGAWTEGHGWLHIVSDLLIFGAYFTIPALIAYFVIRRRDVPFHRIFWAFGAFILFCGLGHLLEALMFWYPAYRFNGVIKACTATVSWITVISLIPVLPRALRLPRLEVINANLEREVRERQRAEEQLSERQEQLSLALQASSMGTWQWLVPEGKMNFSEEACGLFRTSTASTTFVDFLMLIHAEDRSQVERAVRDALERKDGRDRFNFEFRLENPDLPLRWLAAHGQAFFGSSGKPQKMLGTVMDVTKRRELESHLLHAQKLESVGRLAGGIAHDFNNLLTVVMGNAELVETQLAERPRERRLVGEMRASAERGASLTRQLLAFARKQIIQPRVSSVNDLLERISQILRPLLGEQIELAILPDPALAPVLIDPGQFEQVVLNLAINARDAMPAGGKLTIETANVTLNGSDVQSRDRLPPGEYVKMTITDSGEGIPGDLLPFLFEPFFTTKGVGRGTGLGLASVYGIVKQNRGHIEVESALGQGAVFRILLPRHVGVVATEEEEGVAVAEPSPGHSVLIVEDNQALRQMAIEALEMGGYRVLQASSGEQALKLVREHPGAIDLLITDVVLPHMSGMDLAQDLRKSMPQLKVVFISGYTENVIVRDGVIKQGVQFLPKPFSPRSLLQKLREVMSEKGSSSGV